MLSVVMPSIEFVNSKITYCCLKDRYLSFGDRCLLIKVQLHLNDMEERIFMKMSF